jgi:hypothetical protein
MLKRLLNKSGPNFSNHVFTNSSFSVSIN